VASAGTDGDAGGCCGTLHRGPQERRRWRRQSDDCDRWRGEGEQSHEAGRQDEQVGLLFCSYLILYAVPFLLTPIDAGVGPKRPTFFEWIIGQKCVEEKFEKICILEMGTRLILTFFTHIRSSCPDLGL
jgi:hypothetical protein